MLIKTISQFNTAIFHAYGDNYSATINGFLTSSVTLVRGVPGVGKSTLAEALAAQVDDVVVIEANQYFTIDGGEHEYDAELLEAAHEDAQKRMCEALAEGKGVILSNTFKSVWEAQGYLDKVDEMIPWNVVTLNDIYDNIHNIPAEVVNAQLDKLTHHDDFVAELQESKE